MDRVKIDLKNCYGIKSVTKDFDFSKSSAYAIYAPNGVMKSSLARTFQDAADGNPSEDRIFPARATSRRITDENGKIIEGTRILVVFPYDEEFGPTEGTSTLLVDAKLRKEYEQLHSAIDQAKAALLKAVREQADSKRNFAQEIASAFTSGDDFDIAVGRVRAELQQQKDAPFAHVKYDIIFDEKVTAALESKNLKTAVESYIRRYNELLANSTFFKKGMFDYYNAAQVAKTLSDNGFFEARHTVTLKGSNETREIGTQKELEEVISKEKEIIIKDSALRKQFDVVAKELNKNVQLREFCRYLQDNEALLSKMNNLSKFKEDVLKSYLKEKSDLYEDLMAKYDAAASRKSEIQDEASKQRTRWEEVIEIFNDRFFVPFRLDARNRIEVMLGDDAIIELGFTYVDGKDSINIGKPRLMEVLSQGEKKALYILNVIFEVQTRRQAGQQTLIVVDDLADSFDYQNKYAIIQYLRDISSDGLFKLIIMTHNFDFFRTIESRFVDYPNCLIASKTDKGVTLAPAKGIRNVFARDWKGAFFSDARKQIASIPFLRNLIEMTTGESDPNYLKLTSMLHWKSDTAALTVGDLDGIYNAICKTAGNSADQSQRVCDLIEEQAKACLSGGTGLNLENKIILAIMIRMSAEKFIVEKLGEPHVTESIKANQTHVLIDKFKQKFPDAAQAARVLDQVSLMTPENIHVNAFMYEPIIDMSDDHLKKLHSDIQKLIR